MRTPACRSTPQARQAETIFKNGSATARTSDFDDRNRDDGDGSYHHGGICSTSTDSFNIGSRSRHGHFCADEMELLIRTDWSAPFIFNSETTTTTEPKLHQATWGRLRGLFLGLKPGLHPTRFITTASALPTGVGTSYGNDSTFMTLTQPAPTVSTSPADLITATSARMNGTFDSHGLVGTIYFQFGTTTNDGSQTPSGDMGPPAGPVLDQTGLAPNTLYHYRVGASDVAEKRLPEMT